MEQPRNPASDDRTRTESAPEDPWAPGARVAGKYEIVACLGSGGFGKVYKVRHVFRKKYYALKTPHPQFLVDDAFRRRFEREIEAMERCVHPDAVMVRDCGMTETGLPYYTMDYIEGESLRAVLGRETLLAPARALEIVRRILRVLEAAHGSRIIHRDIKPENILLARAGGGEQVKVLDFGVAKLLDKVSVTSAHGDSHLGTPRYMSPEQITGDELDARSDIFSLGIVFYEMLTGRHPFGRDLDPVRATAAILNRPPVPLQERDPGIPRSLCELVLWMIEKKPRKRPESAAALLAALPELGTEVPRVVLETAALAVFPGATRARTTGLVLRQEPLKGDRQPERRLFLLFRARVSFGRSAESRGLATDLILRCLPCESKEEDPENWRRNLTISGRAGLIYPDGMSLVIDGDGSARGGMTVGGVRMPRPVLIQTDQFHFSLGDRALEIDGVRRLRQRDYAAFDLSFLARGRPQRAESSSTGVGYGNEGCAIDHVRLRRANNFPQHEYFLVYRQILIGSGAAAGIRLAGLAGEHAIVVHEGGEAFLTPADGEVKVSRPMDGAAGEGGRLQEEVVLSMGTFYPLVPGIECILGNVRFKVEGAAPRWFKKV